MHTKNALILAPLLLFTSCSLLQRNSVEIKNESDEVITGITFAFADDVHQRSSLAPGETWSFSPSPDTDGGISLTYAIGEGEVDHQLGYAAPPNSMTCELTVAREEVRGDCMQN